MYEPPAVCGGGAEGRFIKASTKSLNKAVTLKHTSSFTQDSPENKDYSM